MIAPMSSSAPRIPYHPLSERDQFATIYRVARWLRAAVDWSAVDPQDAELFRTEVWEPLTRENPAERAISAAGVQHLNKLAAAHLPLDLNHRYHLSRLHVAGDSDRFEFSCLQIQPQKLTMAIARVPRRGSRAREITVEFDDRGAVVKLRPDPTKGLPQARGGFPGARRLDQGIRPARLRYRSALPRNGLRPPNAGRIQPRLRSRKFLSTAK